MMYLKKIIVLLFFFLSSIRLEGHIVGINNRINDGALFGFVGIKGDLNSMSFNPAIIINSIEEKKYFINLGISYMKKVNYFTSLGINSGDISFPLLLSYRKSISEDKSDNSVINSDIYSLSFALADPVAGTGVIGGFNIVCKNLSKEIDGNTTKGKVYFSSFGLIKQLEKFGIGVTWHNGGRIRWEIDTVLGNVIPDEYNVLFSWSFTKFFLIINWTHLFPVGSYVSFNSTKYIILKDGENRFGITGIIELSNNFYASVGFKSFQYDLLDYRKKERSILSRVGLIGQIEKNIKFNILYYDNLLIKLSNNINKYRYISISLNYNFNL